MNLRMKALTAAGLALSIGAIGSTANAQTSPCASLPPLSVGNAVAGAEILARAGEEAIKGLPQIQLRTGAEIVRSSYAGMRNQAMSTVLGWYQCRIVERVTAEGGANLPERLTAIGNTFFELSLLLDEAENASSDYANFTAFQQQRLVPYQRSATAFTLPQATFNSYFSDINPSATWISTSTKTVWITGSVNSVSVIACGGVVRKAISDGGSAIQAGLGAIQANLGNYLNPVVQARIGLAGLVRPFAANPATVTGEPSATFQGCALAIANAAPPVAETPVVPAPPQADPALTPTVDKPKT